MSNLWNEFDRLFGVFPYPGEEVCHRHVCFERKKNRNPFANVSLEGTDMLVELELPGVKKEDVSVSIVEGELLIKWTDREGLAREHTIVLPYSPTGKAKASLKRGLLTVKVPTETVEQKVEVE